MKRIKKIQYLCDELLTRMYIDASVQSAPLGWSKKQVPIAKYGGSMMIGRQWFITREDNCWHRVRLVIRRLLTDVLIIVRADQELSIVGSSHLQMNRMLSDSGCHSHIVLFSHTHCFTLATLLPPWYLLSSKIVYFNKTKHVFFIEVQSNFIIIRNYCQWTVKAEKPFEHTSRHKITEPGSCDNYRL